MGEIVDCGFVWEILGFFEGSSKILDEEILERTKICEFANHNLKFSYYKKFLVSTPLKNFKFKKPLKKMAAHQKH
jgi:hypothetical protein